MTSITAQSGSNPSYDSGFSFKNSMVIGDGPTYLGRPWGNYSQVVFSYTYMDNSVLPKGWEDWNDTKRYMLVLKLIQQSIHLDSVLLSDSYFFP